MPLTSEQRKKRRAYMREYMRKYSKNDLYRAKKNARVKKNLADPEKRERKRAYEREYYRKNREKLLASSRRYQSTEVSRLRSKLRKAGLSKQAIDNELMRGVSS